MPNNTRRNSPICRNMNDPAKAEFVESRLKELISGRSNLGMDTIDMRFASVTPSTERISCLKFSSSGLPAAIISSSGCSEDRYIFIS